MHKEAFSERFSQFQIRIHLFKALKIGLGSALAIFLSYLFSLPNPASAGTITLLTLMATTRKDTLRLMEKRIVSFFFTVLLCGGIFQTVENSYLAYAIFLIVLVFLLELVDWQTTLSVNSVIGAHFLINRDFSFEFIGYEFLLLMIGILIAMVLNFIQPDRMIETDLSQKARAIETEMKIILLSLADRIELRSSHELDPDILSQFRKDVRSTLEKAASYSKNSFLKKDEWYLHYFELRFAQYALLHECARDIRGLESKLPYTPQTAHWVREIADQVSSIDNTQSLIEQGRRIKTEMMTSCAGCESLEQPMILLFILDDLEEYLVLKRDFIDRLSPEQRESFQQSHIKNA